MSGSGTSSPSDIGGGSDMCDGLMALLKPAVEELDKQVLSAKKSQIMLAERIQEISDALHDMNDDEPYDLDELIRKLDDCRRRMAISYGIISNVNERLGVLQREIAREIHAKKQAITAPPPASPIR
ncbi:hypothetical protein WR25_05565 [Diploscapter pachys]|uniref:Biogenesis of lysosome-related organelles complex 1 subunit 7 n=1 Tax=Diploscapter pachys TaxID=2018661 RepID=A0A2A2LTN3_9BILA|nr:hypothetical protein WR25_05565 [Diploscapter pachys]